MRAQGLGVGVPAACLRGPVQLLLPPVSGTQLVSKLDVASKTIIVDATVDKQGSRKQVAMYVLPGAAKFQQVIGTHMDERASMYICAWTKLMGSSK